MHAPQRQPVHRPQARDRLTRLRHPEAELRVGLTGGDLLVGLAADVRCDAYEHRLATAAICQLAVGDEPRQPLDLIEVVDHYRSDPMAQRHAQLRLGLGVSV